MVREALRREEQIPQVAVSFGFADEAAALTAANALADHLDGVQDVLTRIHARVAEELVII